MTKSNSPKINLKQMHETGTLVFALLLLEFQRLEICERKPDFAEKYYKVEQWVDFLCAAVTNAGG